MMLELPDPEQLYAALLARDAAYDGRAFVCVASTGIFCRLTCPAPKPKRENCTFHDTAAACAAQGFRPCKRCHPVGGAEPFVLDLLAALQADPGRRWGEADLVARGLDPSTVRRAFRRAFGSTFLDMARAARLRAGFGALKAGGRVIEAQLDAGFASASGFRAAFARLLGRAPGSFTGREMLKAEWLDTPLGPMIAVCDARALHLLEFVERPALRSELGRLAALVKGDLGIGRTGVTDRMEAELRCYFAGEGAGFEVPLAFHGSTFTRAVWDELIRIPAGATRSYSEIARAIGRPEAVRAVARANGANQIAILIPCHRVIGADGALTGYGGGLWRKERLIALERGYAERDPHRAAGGVGAAR